MPNASNFGFKISSDPSGPGSCFHLGPKCTFAILHKCTFAILPNACLQFSHWAWLNLGWWAHCVFIWAQNALLQFWAHWELNRSCTVLQPLLNRCSTLVEPWTIRARFRLGQTCARRRPLVAAVQLCKNAVLPGGQNCFSDYNGNTSNCERLVRVCLCLTPVPGRQRNLLYENGTVVHLHDLFMLKLLQTSSKT